MKKSVLFAIFATIVMGINSVKAQSSCPVILNGTFHFITDQSNPCTRSISFDFYNPGSGNKWINVNITVNNVQVINDCVDAKGQPNVTRTYTSATFTACSLSSVVVKVTPYTGNSCGGSACGATLISTAGSPLPVTFGTFIATKNGSAVVLKWETLTEINNSGFAIERNINGNWEQIAFVNTLAAEGNSTNKLTYQYVDANMVKGMIQYRIKQVDFNGNFKYSEVRAVRNDDQVSKTTVFPNPSVDGKVTVVYSDNAARDITLFDMSGRVVKQWRNYSANTLQIANLTPGMYSIRAANLENGTQSAEKIMVSNH
jgi:hypothetical protein